MDYKSLQKHSVGHLMEEMCPKLIGRNSNITQQDDD